MSVQNGIAGEVYKARVYLVEVPGGRAPGARNSAGRASGREDGAVDWVEERLKVAGHHLIGRVSISEPAALHDVITTQQGHADVVLFVGGVGMGRAHSVPEVLAPAFDQPIPGFGEQLRAGLADELGAGVMWCRATAGVHGSLAIFAFPALVAACRIALDQLILPEMAHLLVFMGAPGAVHDGPTPLPSSRMVPTPSPREERSTAVSTSSTSRGVNPHGVAVNLGAPDELGPIEDDAATLPVSGWKAALTALEAEILPRGERVPLPDVLERLAPVINVLHSAGQIGGFKLPNGRKFGLYGWPDLTRPSSKVIAVASGHPWGSALALHRYPVPTGICAHVPTWVPSFRSSVSDACAQLSDRMPKDVSGELFAVQGNAVWIRQGGRVMMWDGRSVKSEGTEKQALARLFLHWSQK